MEASATQRRPKSGTTKLDDEQLTQLGEQVTKAMSGRFDTVDAAIANIQGELESERSKIEEIKNNMAGSTTQRKPKTETTQLTAEEIREASRQGTLDAERETAAGALNMARRGAGRTRRILIGDSFGDAVRCLGWFGLGVGISEYVPFSPVARAKDVADIVS